MLPEQRWDDVRECCADMPSGDAPRSSRPSGGLASGFQTQGANWLPDDHAMFYLRVPPDRIVFGYGTDDPPPASVAGITAVYPVAVSECGFLLMKIEDLYDVAGNEGRFRQQILVDGRVVWDQDVAGGVAFEWMTLETVIDLQGETVEVRAQVVALGSPEAGWNWGEASRMSIRNVRFFPCPT